MLSLSPIVGHPSRLLRGEVPADMQRCPSPKYLFASLRLFVRILHTDFGVSIPDVNLPLVSWRVVRSLGGSREF
jgi:hypothetical protein